MTYPPSAPSPAPKTPRRTHPLVLIGAGLALFLVGIAIGGGANSSNTPTDQQQVAGIYPQARTVTVTATVTATPTAAASPTAAGVLTSFSDGSYEVGVDVQPGKYKTVGQGFCYWERAKNDSGELGAILANDNVNGPATVTLKAGETFKSKRCGTWTRS